MSPSRLFHHQIILYRPDSLDAPGDFTRFLGGILRINEAAQLDGAFVSLDTDLKRLKKMIFRKERFHLGRDNRIVHVFTRTFPCTCRCTDYKGGDEHEKDQTADKHPILFHS